MNLIEKSWFHVSVEYLCVENHVELIGEWELDDWESDDWEPDEQQLDEWELDELVAGGGGGDSRRFTAAQG